MSLDSLDRRINRLLTAIEQRKRYTRLPVRYLSEAGEVAYETPASLIHQRVAYKEYVGFDPDEDGSEP